MEQGRSQHADRATGPSRQGSAFRVGDRVVLVDAPPDYPEQFDITPGMTGSVDVVDSQRTVHVRWDAGQRFGVIAPVRHLLKHEGDDQ